MIQLYFIEILLVQRTLVPKDWHIAPIACLYKKGDSAIPDSYRPVSLLPVGYKVFASILLSRIKQGGAEQKIHETQYGIKSKSGTRDAICILRRLLDQCALSKNSNLIVLALDWAKAFDSVDPACLAKSLLRFGIPQQIVSIIEAIYRDRSFYVADNWSESDIHIQSSGISQGCPLSPFLFIILMTVLMHDAKQDLRLIHNVDLSSSVLCHDFVC